MKDFFDYKNSLKNFIDNFDVDEETKKDLNSVRIYNKIFYIDEPWFCFKSAAMNYFYKNNSESFYKNRIFQVINKKSNYQYWFSKDKKFLLIKHSYINGVTINNFHLFDIDKRIEMNDKILKEVTEFYGNKIKFLDFK